MGIFENRELIASLFISGEGIEIGALHQPLKVPKNALVTYVDRFDTIRLQNEQYPELHNATLCPIGIIDDAESLHTIFNDTYDFVIANHLIEHCKNTIKSLLTFFRVLKTGGILFLCVPDNRYTFDKNRPVTPLNHHISEYELGDSDTNNRPHYEEWVALVDNITEPILFKERVDYLIRIGYSIHFHCWTYDGFLEVLKYVASIINLELLLCFQNNNYEGIFVLRKM